MTECKVYEAINAFIVIIECDQATSECSLFWKLDPYRR